MTDAVLRCPGCGAPAPAPGAPDTPPPIPSAVPFYVAVDGAPHGPLDMAAQRARQTGGALRRDTLVWRPGMPAWTSASQVPELAPLFADS